MKRSLVFSVARIFPPVVTLHAKYKSTRSAVTIPIQPTSHGTTYRGMLGTLRGFLCGASILALLTFCLGWAETARAVLIHFDDLPDGTVLTTQYAAQGAVFSASLPIYIRDLTLLGPGYATSSPPNIASPSFDSGNPAIQATLRVDFNSPKSAVSFYAIDVGDWSRVARAYDVGNNLLETIVIENPGSVAGIGNIDYVAFSVNNISYFTFAPGADVFPGDGAGIDDLFFVPEPATALLIGITAMSTMLRRPRKRGNQRVPNSAQNG